MTLELALWKVVGEQLVDLAPSRLNLEDRLEAWIATNPAVLGMDLAVLGRQVHTEFGGRIDVLALDQNANCVILELKRDRTPRDVIAQLLDYASWVGGLGFDRLNDIARCYAKVDLATIFRAAFNAELPEEVNSTHCMVVVAAELDDSSERIISYLSTTHGVNINAVFFRFYRDGQSEMLGRAWFRDPDDALERLPSKKQVPWSGHWYVNVDECPARHWDDCVQYGYLGAGGGEKYTQPLKKLVTGSHVFAYFGKKGYVGYGVVTSEAVPIDRFVVERLRKPLLELPLSAPEAALNKDSPELCEWAVGVRWLKTYGRDDAKTFKGIFSNPNVVCRLRNPQTLAFLQSAFGLPPEGG